MSWVRMCCRTISRTSAADTAGPMLCRQSCRKLAAFVLVARVLGLCFLDSLSQVGQDSGQVRLELLLRLAELLDLRELVVQESANEPVQLPRAGHVDAHCLLTVLDEDGGLGVLEDDVVARVAAIELELYLGSPGRLWSPWPPSSPGSCAGSPSLCHRAGCRVQRPTRPRGRASPCGRGSMSGGSLQRRDGCSAHCRSRRT